MKNYKKLLTASPFWNSVYQTLSLLVRKIQFFFNLHSTGKPRKHRSDSNLANFKPQMKIITRFCLYTTSGLLYIVKFSTLQALSIQLVIGKKSARHVRKSHGRVMYYWGWPTRKCKREGIYIQLYIMKKHRGGFPCECMDRPLPGNQEVGNRYDLI